MIRTQFIRYAVIGLGLNAALYGAYLLLTASLLGSRAAMTVTYGSGVLIGFLLNRAVTFRYLGGNHGALLRYVATYAIGYAINFMALRILVDDAGVPHQLVQGVMIFTLPLILFPLQKYWVFRVRSQSNDFPRVRPVP